MIKNVHRTTDVDPVPAPMIGLGFRPQLKSEIFLHRNEIDFLEITADHYLDAGPAKLAELDLLREHFPLIPHALNLSLGSAEGVDAEYLDKFAALVERVDPPWCSDHICFTRSGGIDIGHLSPVPFTREAIAVLVRNVAAVRKRIRTPLILENITYMFRYPFSEMGEAEFLRNVLEETDCGLLLDVTNLYINSVNHGFDWRRFLDELPMERVVQLHFVGGHRHREYLIDSHAFQTPAEIWDVFREVCERGAIRGAILERDGNFPPFAEIRNELAIARKLANPTRAAAST